MFLKNKDIDELCKIINKKWEILSLRQQKSIIVYIIDLFKKDIFPYWVQEGSKNIKNINFIDDKFLKYGQFQYKEKTLNINVEKFTKPNYKNEVLKIILHEIYHAYQYVIYVNNENSLYSKLYFNKLTNIENHTNLFTYTLFHQDYPLIEDTSYLFYALNPIEREAIINSETLAIKYENNINMTMPKTINNFNNRYKCNYKQEEVFNIIDECYDRLYKENYINMREIVANVLYDMQQIILLENNKYTAEEANQNLKNKYNPTKLLEQSKTDTSIKCPYIESIEQFRKLDSIQQVNNPKVVYKAVINFQESVIPYINNIHQLENILEIYSDILSDKCKETINNQMENLTNRENKQNYILDEK